MLDSARREGDGKPNLKVHFLPHKEGNSEEMRSIMIGLPDCVGTEMKMRDDLLEATRSARDHLVQLNYSYLYQPVPDFFAALSRSDPCCEVLATAGRGLVSIIRAVSGFLISSVPLKKAPSSIEIRAVERSPVKDAFLNNSTRSLAWMSPSTRPYRTT